MSSSYHQDTKVIYLVPFVICVGEEPCYAGVPMSTIIEKGYGVGDVISLLWFKRSLPRYCTQFIEVGLSFTFYVNFN